jgi:hypothetical protein
VTCHPLSAFIRGSFLPIYPQDDPRESYIDWRMRSPRPRLRQPDSPPAPPPAFSLPIPASSAPAIDQEELVKRVEAMLLMEKQERQARDVASEAKLKVEAEAEKAKAARAASDRDQDFKIFLG